MRQIRYRVLGVVAVLVVLGCQGMPKATTTGHVIDVAILDSEAPGDIAVNPGDEVRWVNKRTAPVRVILIDPVSDKQVSCRNRFGGFMAPSDTAKLAGSETASICFRDAGVFRYVVRMASDSESGEINVAGVIKVGTPGNQAVGQTGDPGRSAKQRAETSTE